MPALGRRIRFLRTIHTPVTYDHGSVQLFVLGATGKTGLLLTAQALARGHAITAFGRTPLTDRALQAATCIIGNPMDADRLAAAMPRHDAVLSVLGTRGLGATSLLVDSACAIIAAMQRARVRRLIVMSSSLVDANGAWFPLALSKTLLRHTTGDQRAMEQLVTDSPLDWTVVRPARLNDRRRTGRYITTCESAGRPASDRVVPRGDVADLMLDAAEGQTYINQIVWVRGARR
jgi:putative NADH-flavin reductase